MFVQKKYKSLCKKFANFFSLCFVFLPHIVIIIQRRFKAVVVGPLFFCFADGIVIFLVLLGIGDDETHILGDNLLETIGAGVSKKSCGALR